MLNPDERQLYVDALRPPLGYRLCEAVATTYSLDMTTLLGIPIALVLPHLDVRKLGSESAVTVLEGLRRSSKRISVFCDRGGIAEPGVPNVLYPLLERVIVEAKAPGGGCLHSKLWLLSYERDDEDVAADELVMRLVVLSRNLTADRCWDVSLVLDGRLTGKNRAANRPLCELIEALPNLAVHDVDDATRARVGRLSEQARRTEWELPRGFDELWFHVMGLSNKAKRWLPVESDRLLVISPFVRDSALAALASTTHEPVALIARAEELDCLAPATRAPYAKVFVLHERAETEDGEEGPGATERPIHALFGLHAKVYICKRGWDTHVYVGSANATDAAFDGKNVEILAELIGKSSKVPGRGIDGALDMDGLGALLVEYTPNEPSEQDRELEAAERALDRAANALASAQLSVRFERSPEDVSDLVPRLQSATALDLPSLAALRARLVTVDPSNARDVRALVRGETAELAPCTTAAATGLVAFELVSDRELARKGFVLNLPVLGLPSDRDAHVVRLVIDNREKFFAFLLALLESFDANAVDGFERSSAGGTWWQDGSASHGLLEHLVRARARDPRRLDELRAIVRDLQTTEEGRAIMPSEFLDLWNAIAEEAAP